MLNPTVKIANVSKRVDSLPVIIDRDMLISIKAKVDNKESLTPDDCLYFDEIANKIMDVVREEGQIVNAAFLLKQLPFIHKNMINEYIENVCESESPIAAFYAIELNSSINSNDRHDDLVAIIINNGSIPLLIESVRAIPDIPILSIVKKVNLSNQEDIGLWSDSIVAEAKIMYKDLCERLKIPVEPTQSESENTGSSADAAVDEVSRKGIASIIRSPIQAIKEIKK